jgi:hypothetical protein
MAALAFAGSAGAGVGFGVSDDHPEVMADGGAKFFSIMNDIGLSVDRLTIHWDAALPTTIPNKVGLDRAITQAKDHGIDIVLSVYPLKPTALGSSANATDEFVTFLQIVAAAYPSVHTIVVGNEFNQPKFYQPQFGPNCAPAAGAAYAKLLARSYDALKAIDKSIRVISSVSPRGNDDCHASSNISTSPVQFIHSMGVAYQSLNRTKPLVDDFGINLYPNESTDSVAKGYQWPKIGFANLDRLKQALWDAFHGTAQPVPGAPPAYRFGHSIASASGVTTQISEIGWQVQIDKAHLNEYHGTESVKTTTEANQAEIYSQLVHQVSCDPTVSTMMFFGLVDETDLDRFQAGLLRADWSQRPSYYSVKNAIAQTGGDCSGTEAQWRPATNPIGVSTNFGKIKNQWWKQTWWGFTATAKEDSTFSAGVFKIPGSTPTGSFQIGVQNALSNLPGRAPVKVKPTLTRTGVIKAYWSPLIHFAPRRLKAGRYVYAITIRAQMDPTRTSFFQSKPFQVLARKTKHH